MPLEKWLQSTLRHVVFLVVHYSMSNLYITLFQDKMKKPGCTDFKHGSFQHGFRTPFKAKQAPFRSASASSKRSDGNVGQRTGHLIPKVP